LRQSKRFSTRLFKPIQSSDRSAWNRLFRGCAENWDFMLGCESAHPPNFDLSALGIECGGELVAGVPVYETTFPIGMLFHERLRPALNYVERFAPKLVNPSVIAAGSPYMEELALTISAELTDAEKREVLQLLLDSLLQLAREKRSDYIYVQDVNDRDARIYDDLFGTHGFYRIPGSPLAQLHVPFSNREEYIRSLTPKMRSSIRRNIKKASGIRVEITDSPTGLTSELWRLRQNTSEQARATFGPFEELHERYFAEVANNLRDTARFFLFYSEDELIGFHLILLEKNRIITKAFGAKYPVAKERGLYFLNWISFVDYAIEHGYEWVQTGITAYLTKIRLGCKLERRWIYSRHRIPARNAVEKRLAPLLSVANLDPDHHLLDEETNYVAGCAGWPTPVQRTFDLALIDDA
jgi:predicted N-acyltransferase